jgi:hypothetical protein
MYHNTQDWFKQRNIEHVWVYRGMKDLTPEEWNLKFGESEIGKANITLQPLSSFSSDYSTANGFAYTDKGTMVAAQIPVGRIMGGCRSGFGCLSEREVVVIGGKTEAYAYAWTSSRSKEIVSGDKFVDAVKELEKDTEQQQTPVKKQTPEPEMPAAVKTSIGVWIKQPDGAYMNSADHKVDAEFVKEMLASGEIKAL